MTRQFFDIFCLFLVIISSLQGVTALNGTKPHIIIILADDLGYNDVGYNAVNGSAIKTPKIDDLAANGVKLSNYYVQPQCSPSRSQLLTGHYPIHNGLQHNKIDTPGPYCLPLSETTMAEKLRGANYSTHMVGKWHLGFYDEACTPTHRGFDSFLGYYAGYVHYNSLKHTWRKPTVITACDFRFDNTTATGIVRNVKMCDDFTSTVTTVNTTDIYRNETRRIMKEHNETHSGSGAGNITKPLFLFMSMQLPHTPLTVDNSYLSLYDGIITNAKRKTLAGMLSALDDAVGHAVQYLKDYGFYNNSVILFSSDNGAPTNNGNNWPLRGGKNTLFEGGMRTVGFIHSPLLPANVKGTTSNALIHIGDWFPTFVSTLANVTLDENLQLDGKDVWSNITNITNINNDDSGNNRTILHNIDCLHTRRGSPHIMHGFDISIQAALRMGHFKIITGDPGADTGWTKPPESSIVNSESSPDPADKRLWLFNITADPKEKTDLSDDNAYQDVLQVMLGKLKEYYDNSVKPIYPSNTRKAKYDPNTKTGGLWDPWKTILSNPDDVPETQATCTSGGSCECQ